jgi:hypothetical protein
MAEMWMEFKVFYWAHREVFRVLAASSVFICVQFGILLWTLRVMGELSSLRERMSRLVDGLALLTDTTEAGMSALAAELAQANRKVSPANPGSRATVQKRVKDAVRNGERISRIAALESLSESEVRLHLALSGRDPVKTQAAGQAEDVLTAGSLIA